MKKFNLSENLQRRVLMWNFLLWLVLHALAFFKILPYQVACILNPLLLAYIVEYLIKVADDLHLPNQDFHTIVHVVLSSVMGMLLLAVSGLILGHLSFAWSFATYGTAAIVINWTNLVWTHNEAQEESSQ